MIYVPLSIAVVFGSILYIKNKDIFHPGCLLNGVWSIVLFFEWMNSSNFYKINSRVYLIIAVGLLFYNIGFMTFYIKVKSIKIKGFRAENSQKRTDRRFFIVQVVISCFLFVMLSRMAVYIITGNWYVVRSIYSSGVYQNGSRFMSTFERMLYISYGVFPLAYINYLIGTVAVLDNLISKKSYILSLINMVIITLVTGGRLSVFYMFICFVTIYSRMKMKTGKAPVSNIKRNIIIIATISFAFINISLRSTEDFKGIIDGMISYFIGGIHVFDHALQNPVNYGLEEYTFGVMTFRGFFECISTFVYYASNRVIPLLPSVFANTYFDNAIKIGKDISFNAFPTIFYYHYRDFKWLGVCIIPLVLSGIANTIYNKQKKKANYVSTCLVAEMTYFVIMSPCWSSLIQAEVWCRIIYIYILIYFYGLGEKK